jgi:hypothetical protein
MTKEEKALEYAQKVLGVYFNDIDEDCNATRGEISQLDYLAGYNQAIEDSKASLGLNSEPIEDTVSIFNNSLKSNPQPTTNNDTLTVEQLKAGDSLVYNGDMCNDFVNGKAYVINEGVGSFRLFIEDEGDFVNKVSDLDLSQFTLKTLIRTMPSKFENK